MTWPDWKPVRALIDLEEELEKTFSSLIHEPWEAASQAPSWLPAVDVDETDDAYQVTADLPGVARTHLKLRVETHRIVLQGERTAVRRTRTANRILVERCCGRFARAINLRHPVNPESAETDLQDGVLHLRVEKRRRDNAEHEES